MAKNFNKMFSTHQRVMGVKIKSTGSPKEGRDQNWINCRNDKMMVDECLRHKPLVIDRSLFKKDPDHKKKLIDILNNQSSELNNEVIRTIVDNYHKKFYKLNVTKFKVK